MGHGFIGMTPPIEIRLTNVLASHLFYYIPHQSHYTYLQLSKPISLPLIIIVVIRTQGSRKPFLEIGNTQTSDRIPTNGRIPISIRNDSTTLNLCTALVIDAVTAARGAKGDINQKVATRFIEPGIEEANCGKVGFEASIIEKANQRSDDRSGCGGATG
jgi:hypothetical protein